MKIRTKYILFIAVLHTVALVMSFYIFKEHKLLFLGSELAIICSLALAWMLYNDFIHPVQLLAGGAEAIRDRDFTIKLIKTGAYEMDRLVEVYNRMIDQLREERTIQEEQHFFLEKLIHTAPVGTLVLDFDGYITAVNPKMLEILDLPESALLRHRLPELSHPLQADMARLEDGTSVVIQTPNARKYKLQKASFVDRGFHRAFIMAEDLTVEILEAEKKAYGKVIRMMAHEVNNSIGAVNSVLDTKIQLETDPGAILPLQVAMERNEHLNQFMRRFADVIRLPGPHRQAIDLCALVRNMAALMQFKTGEKNIVFEFDFEQEVVMIQADLLQMEQVLINILKNAIEAIADDGIIRCSVTTSPVSLAIADNGRGIPPELASQLFSPFFTNKNGGQGIGLTLTREIMDQHGFEFSLQTEPDGWTVFRMRSEATPGAS